MPTVFLLVDNGAADFRLVTGDVTHARSRLSLVFDLVKDRARSVWCFETEEPRHRCCIGAPRLQEYLLNISEIIPTHTGNIYYFSSEGRPNNGRLPRQDLLPFAELKKNQRPDSYPYIRAHDEDRAAGLNKRQRSTTHRARIDPQRKTNKPLNNKTKPGNN